jgi:outer membrane murein-binding lipoprotein Lpp
VATDEEARTAVEQLSGQVQELEARIDQVEQAQAEQEATGP